MNLVELVENLVKIPSVSGNRMELKKCLEYCKNYFADCKNVFVREIEDNGVSSVLLSNCDGLSFDVLSVGHVDVVPADNEEMFFPKIVDGKMYGRGALDMKSLVVVSMRLLKYVLENNLGLKFAILIVTDEETGGENGAKYWAEVLKLRSRIILDYDNGRDISLITKRRKGLFRAKLVSKGISAHGSMPWLGIDANENLMNTLLNLRKYFPYMSKDIPVKNEWVTTVHAGIIRGGNAINTICPEAEAYLDFRRTEEYDNEKLMNALNECAVGDTQIEMIGDSKVVLLNLDNDYLKMYKGVVEKHIGREVVFMDRHGATDTRYFVDNSDVIIQHGPNGFGIHSAGEYVEIESLMEFERIQREFLEKVVG